MPLFCVIPRGLVKTFAEHGDPRPRRLELSVDLGAAI